ncbi:MAG TPA: porin [Steroidobacteraceae bacterium]|nr:porin [Steroidobacteraceae bacterium]
MAGWFACTAFAVQSVAPAVAQAEAEAQVLSCVSVDGERQHCPGYTGAGVALGMSTGRATCLLGRNWGYDADGVWVTEGCGGEFLLGKPDHEERRLAAQGGGPTDSAERSADAASAKTAEPASLGDYLVYTRFGAQLAAANDEAEIQDARSRIGFQYETGQDIRFFADAEWSVNLTANARSFYPGETTSSGFLLLDTTRGSVFGTRLGYVGVDFGKSGRVSFGKQWGVHYDVTSYTDAFNVFGAEASVTFNADTDGGLMGTGRADEALVYRNRLFDTVDLGLQVQLRNLDNGEVIDGYGASLRAGILPGLELGVTYTTAHWDDSIKGALVGLKGDAEYGALGVKYESDRLRLAGVYARQRNGDLARIPVTIGEESVLVPVAFDGTGVELAARYQLSRLGLLAGWLNYRPDKGTELADPDAELRYLILGTDYRWNPSALFFAEYRLANGKDPVGIRGEDVFALGFQYRFLKRGSFDFD